MNILYIITQRYFAFSDSNNFIFFDKNYIICFLQIFSAASQLQIETEKSRANTCKISFMGRKRSRSSGSIDKDSSSVFEGKLKDGVIESTGLGFSSFTNGYPNSSRYISNLLEFNRKVSGRHPAIIQIDNGEPNKLRRSHRKKSIEFENEPSKLRRSSRKKSTSLNSLSLAAELDNIGSYSFSQLNSGATSLSGSCSSLENHQYNYINRTFEDYPTPPPHYDNPALPPHYHEDNQTLSSHYLEDNPTPPHYLEGLDFESMRKQSLHAKEQYFRDRKRSQATKCLEVTLVNPIEVSIYFMRYNLLFILEL